MMKRTGMMFVALIVLGLCSYSASAQQATMKEESTPLYEEIARMDAAMFAAFNAHDADKLMSLFSEKLEFYHDLGGLQSYSDVTAGFKRMFAQNNGMRRELVGGTLEVIRSKTTAPSRPAPIVSATSKKEKKSAARSSFSTSGRRKGRPGKSRAL